MIYVSDDRWTCPQCEETVTGTSAHRRAQQRAHGRRHTQRPETVTADPLAPKSRESAAPTDLVIPRAPRIRRTRR